MDLIGFGSFGSFGSFQDTWRRHQSTLQSEGVINFYKKQSGPKRWFGMSFNNGMLIKVAAACQLALSTFLKVSLMTRNFWAGDEDHL